jgi:Putative auto-transporter adhesin, head GIN domain
MKRIIPILFLSIAFSSCHLFHGKRIKGDGNITRQDRPVSGFNRIDVSGAIDVFIRQDSVFGVNVETDNNLQQYIEVYKDGDVLHIHTKDNTNPDPTESIKVYVTAPVYKELEASGACSFNGNSKISQTTPLEIDMSGACDADLVINVPAIKVGVSGACSVTLKGETKDFTAHGSGATTLHCFDLLSENANVDLSGSGNADVYASVKLDARSSGATDIKYKGNAAVNSTVSGAGSIKKVN